MGFSTRLEDATDVGGVMTGGRMIEEQVNEFVIVFEPVVFPPPANATIHDYVIVTMFPIK